MEKRLQDFILSVQQLSDLRNLDTFNPIVFQMEHPINATRYTVVGAKLEPSYLGLPINVTWVVLDPSDPYYMKALKLKVVLDPETVTDKPQIESISAWWHVVRTYDEIFNDPQFYMGIEGIPGPVGPTGPAGAAGASVDPASVMAMLGTLPGTLEIRGLSSVQSGATAQYEVWLAESAIDALGAITMQTRQVYPSIKLLAMDPVTPLPADSSISESNLLTAGHASGTVIAKLVAEYPSWTRIVQAMLNVAIGAEVPVVTSITINGLSSIIEGNTTQYTVTATLSDGTTQTVSATWSSDNNTVATVDANGLVTANAVTATGSANISAAYSGFTATKALQVVDVPTVASISIAGPASVFEGTTHPYVATATYSDGTTQTVSATWSVDNAAASVIAPNGALTALDISADTSTNVSATFDGVTGAMSVQILDVVLTGIVVSGPAVIQGGASAAYTVTASYSNSTTQVVPADSWTVDANGSITAAGVVTTANVNGAMVVTAQALGLTASKNVSISMALDPGYPFFGAGPVLPADWESFILGLPLRGPSADVNANVSFDALGQSAFMYFAYPKSYGEAQFFDSLSQFFGGWGGGGNSQPGPNAASIAASSDKPFETTITYNGAPTVFYVYRSEYANLGPASSNKWVVSPLP